jgi:hypothetical protein
MFMAGRLLVIAIDEDLRRSLAFSLAAHGYQVETLGGIQESEPEGQVDCTIVDEDVAQALGDGATQFFRQHAPVVLLHYNNPSIEVARSLQKPLRGDDIVQAVATALRGYGPPST